MNKAKAKASSKSSISTNAANTFSGNCGPVQSPTTSSVSRSTPPSKKMEKDIPYEGIYQNLRFCETITSLMGNTVQIQLSNGKIFEGIFSTFSPQLEVVLELVHTVDPNQPDKIDIKSVAREVVFCSQLIVTMSSKDVELDYARKDSFATDTSISRFNGGTMGEKELEPWEGDDDECHISLDDANGWDPNDMFARNEKVYGIQSNFEQDLSQYTSKLEKKDSKEYKEMEARALKLANIIESSSASKANTELENVSDEEEKFSAVVRPSHDSSRDRHDSRDFRDFTRSDRGPVGAGATGSASVNSSGGKYVHPNKRPAKGMQNMGKMMRSTPPPHSHGGHTHSNLPPRHQSGGGGGGGGGGSGGSYHGNNYDGDGRGSHSSHGSPGSAHHGGYHQQGGSQHQAFQSSQGRGSSGSYGYGHAQNRSQGQGSSYNNKLSAQQSEPRMNGEDRKINRESSYESKNSHVPSHHMQSQPQRDHGPKEQRKTFAGKNREDQNSDLKKFGQDFRLASEVPAPAPAAPIASVEDKKVAPPAVSAVPATAPVSTTATAATTSTSAAPTAPPVSVPPPTTTAPPPAVPNATSPSATPAAAPAAPPAVPPAVPSSVPPPVTSSAIQTATQTQTANSVTVSPVTSSPSATAGSTEVTSAPSGTPEDKSGSDSVDKVSETLKKSNLNPNAKEFVLNPNARVFVPTPPRSHTPQTPQSTGGGQILVSGPMGTLGPVGPGLGGSGASPGQGIPLMPVVHYVTANPGHAAGVQNQGPATGNNQPHFSAHNPAGTRFRAKPPVMPVAHRPDLASSMSMHVAAATGQPLMAPAPMGGPQLFYPPQGAIIPGTPQPYTQLYTMRVVPGMPGMPTSVYGDSQSTNQGSIYMSPGHGQGVSNQAPMAPPQPQQQHHHPNSTPSPAQHSMPQTPTGNPPQQLIYQTAGGHHGHNPGPPHSHPHASFPLVYLPPGHSTLPPGVAGPNGGPQGVQILPLGTSSAAGMAAMGMMPQAIHYIQQAPGTGGQPSHMQQLVPHNQ